DSRGNLLSAQAFVGCLLAVIHCGARLQCDPPARPDREPLPQVLGYQDSRQAWIRIIALTEAGSWGLVAGSWYQKKLIARWAQIRIACPATCYRLPATDQQIAVYASPNRSPGEEPSSYPYDFSNQAFA